MISEQAHADPGPGIYRGVSFEQYRAWPYVNSSSLGWLERSPAHYRAACENAREPTEAMRLGAFIHAGQLEPLATINRYVVMPDFTHGLTRPDGTTYTNPKATKEYKQRVAEWRAANSDKEHVSAEAYQQLLGIAKALARHPRAAAYVGQGCATEVSIVWGDPATGIRCKGRLDALNEADGRIGELKTTADLDRFAHQMWNRGVDRQMAFYHDGYRQLTGKDLQVCLVVVETEAPYAIQAAPVGLVTLAEGRTRYRRLLRLLAECRERDEWLGPADPDAWELPASKLTPAEIIINGQPITV